MKTLVFAIMLAAMTAGFATQASAYDACAGNNSKACRDARNAFARHHGGVYPGQFENRAYNNRGYYDDDRGYYNNRAYYNNNGRGYWNGRDNDRDHEWRHQERREEHREHHDRHDHD